MALNNMKTFAIEQKKFFKDLIDRYMAIHIPRESSGASLYSQCKENAIIWGIKTSAYNYHDESWIENEEISLGVADDEICEQIMSNSNLGLDDIAKDKFNLLIKEIVKNSESVTLYDKGAHRETEEGKIGSINYNYHSDIEILCCNPYNMGINVCLRKSRYDTLD